MSLRLVPALPADNAYRRIPQRIWDFATHRIAELGGEYAVQVGSDATEWRTVGTAPTLAKAERLLVEIKNPPRRARQAVAETAAQDNLPRSALDGPLLPRSVWVGNG